MLCQGSEEEKNNDEDLEERRVPHTYLLTAFRLCVAIFGEGCLVVSTPWAAQMVACITFAWAI